jgi:transcription elongation GreA/GreB family factor
VADEDGAEVAYEITGEDEADAALGRIAPQSPLARALIGARVGDVVTWRRPAGAVELEILKIEVPDDP